ncbi:MAG: hypothetical protein IJQ80_08180 [Clostridia bacterium]|nr:hypothetical protein [Clostridia bacterium]
MKKARLDKWDYYKLFLICCVVIGHIGNYYAASSPPLARVQFWVYLFHMPAFIFVSGLFSKKTVDGRKWSRAVPYLFIFILMKALQYAVSIAVYGFEKSSLVLFTEEGVPWYALAMFFFIGTTILVRNVHPAYVLSVSAAISLISGYTASLGGFLALQRTVIFYPFFYLGYLIDTEKFTAFTNKLWVRIASVPVVAASAVFVYLKYDDIKFWRDLFRGIFLYNEITDKYSPIWGFSWRLAFYAISLIMIVCTVSLMPTFRSFIAGMGSRTLPVFVLHYPVIVYMVMKVKWFRNWFSSGHVALHSALFCLVLVVVLSLPVFDYPIRKIMRVPARKKKEAVEKGVE